MPLPDGPLGLTSVTLSGKVTIGVVDQKVRLGVDNTHLPLSPAMARQVAAWLMHYADEADRVQVLFGK